MNYLLEKLTRGALTISPEPFPIPWVSRRRWAPCSDTEDQVPFKSWV